MLPPREAVSPPAPKGTSIGNSEEEAAGEFVAGVAEFAVPRGGELIVGIGTGNASGKRDGLPAAVPASYVGQRIEISVGSRAELIALEREQRCGDRIDFSDAGEGGFPEPLVAGPGSRDGRGNVGDERC